MMMASTLKSSPNLTAGRWTYDVFLSFAGKDTRKGFVGHLYRALDERGVYTFIDELRLHMGDSISDVLLRSIKESMIAVIVLSRKYADSSWCLDELVKIMECKKLMGQTVIPVFYNLDPSIVRWQKGVIAEAFWKHEIRYENDLEKVQRWRDALADVANLSGCHVLNTVYEHESDCIIKIVQEISSKCNRLSSTGDNLVGIVPRMEKVKLLLESAADDVRFIGIWGMGGSGKTTLAWAVYSEISNQFQGMSFIANVKEELKRSDLHFLQQKLLSQILLDKNISISNSFEGTALMSQRMRCKKVLVVLDDVDDDSQLYKLAGRKDWFDGGSRVIITTRDKHLLEMLKVDEIYCASLLNDDEAIQLFSLYAFHQKSPPEEWMNETNRVVHYACGLPLALRVLGSFLCGRSNMADWESAISRLEVEPDDKIFEALKISFDGLSKIEQKIFLDIACFFQGAKKSRVTRILDTFGLHANIGISVLIQKSLVSVSNDRLDMHDRIQEMGWHIVRGTSGEPGKYSRLWLHNDVHHVLTNETGTDEVECIYLNSSGQKPIAFAASALRKMNELRLLYFRSWPPSSSGFEFLPEKSKWFSKAGQYLPSRLQWLTWDGYPSDSLPEGFIAKKLVRLEMRFGSMVRLWKGKKSLENLRVMDLSRSDKLKKIPDLKGAPNLETLILDHCNSLVEVHQSVRAHERLVTLSLQCCEELTSLPSPLCMKSLKTLVLSDCEKLKRFPEIMENMDNLSELYLNGTLIEELSPSIGKLSGLIVMDLSDCKCLTNLPSTIGNLKRLRNLNLSDCRKLERLPENLGEIQSLEELFLNSTSIKEAPSSIVLLKNIKTLSTDESYELMFSLLLRYSHAHKLGLELPPLLSFGCIKKLSARNCLLSEGDIPHDLSPLFSLEDLDLSGNLLTSLPAGICKLPRLKQLDVTYCFKLNLWQGVPSTIARLQADKIRSFQNFRDLFGKCESLWKLSLVGTVIPNVDNPINEVLQYLLQGHLLANHRAIVLVPGISIPEWFNQQHPGDYTCFQLPLNWLNNILGLAICVFLGHTSYIRPIYMNIQFKFIDESEKQQPDPASTSTEIPLVNQVLGGPMENQVWLGFMSFDFFQRLFPKVKPDDWSNFDGYLSARFSCNFNEFKMLKCAIRPVYKEDVEQVPTLQSSAVLSDHMGRPWLQYKYDHKDDEEDCEIYTKSDPNLLPDMVYLDKTGHNHAAIRWTF